MKYVKVYDDWACINIPGDDVEIITEEDRDIMVNEVKSIICDNGPKTIEICMDTNTKGARFQYLLILMDIPMKVLVDYDTRSDIDVLYAIKGSFSGWVF